MALVCGLHHRRSDGDVAARRRRGGAPDRRRPGHAQLPEQPLEAALALADLDLGRGLRRGRVLRHLAADVAVEVTLAVAVRRHVRWLRRRRHARHTHLHTTTIPSLRGAVEAVTSHSGHKRPQSRAHPLTCRAYRLTTRSTMQMHICRCESAGRAHCSYAPTP